MSIQVFVPRIDNLTYQSILEYYNKNKEPDEAPLQRLDRAEGGFQIELPRNEWKKNDFGIIDSNGQIRQLRWSNGKLTSGEYKGFTESQTALLFVALTHSLPAGQVHLI